MCLISVKRNRFFHGIKTVLSGEHFSSYTVEALLSLSVTEKKPLERGIKEGHVDALITWMAPRGQ